MQSRQHAISGKINDTDIRLLRIFKAVVECGGFSAAETELNITGSTISSHMADLESRLDLKLCHRGRSGFSLTEQGALVYDAALKLLSSLEGFRSEVNTIHNRLTGELSIVCSDAMALDGRLQLTERLAEFESQAPDVLINLSIQNLHDSEKAVLDGKADIAFFPVHRELRQLAYLPLYRETQYLYCATGHPLFEIAGDEILVEDIQQAKFIHPGVHTEHATDILEQLNRSANAYHYETRLALVKTGRFIGFFSDEYVKPWLKDGSMRALKPQQFCYSLDVAAVTRRSQSKNQALQLFLGLLAK